MAVAWGTRFQVAAVTLLTAAVVFAAGGCSGSSKKGSGSGTGTGTGTGSGSGTGGGVGTTPPGGGGGTTPPGGGGGTPPPGGGGGSTPPPAIPTGKLYAIDLRANAVHVYDDPSTKNGDIAPSRRIAGAATLLNEPLNAELDLPRDELYVMNRGASPDEVLVFATASTANGNVPPTRRIVLTGDDIRSSVALDWARDLLYVSRADNTVQVYAAASTLNGAAPAPARTYTFTLPTIAIVRIAVDSFADRLYCPTALNNSIIIVDQASTKAGGTPAYREIKGASTTFSDPLGMSLDYTLDELYIANRNPTPPSLLVFAAASTANGNVAPIRTIAGPATGLATPIDALVHREFDVLYELNDSATGIRTWASARVTTGDVAPARLITGANTGFVFINDICLDPNR